MDAERLPFAENLVFYRKQKKMLQRELAQKLDVSMQFSSSSHALPNLFCS